MRLKVLQPLSGILFLALFAGAFVVAGEPMSASDHSPAEMTKWWTQNAHRMHVAVLLMSVALVAFVAFASHLKAALDSAGGDAGTYSRVMFGGVLIFVAGWATDLTLVMTIIEATKEKLDGAVVQALSIYWDNDWVPFAIGVVLMQLGAALSILRVGGLPKWLGVLSVLIVIASVIPKVGFFALPATAVWVLLASIVMSAKAAKESKAPTV